MTLPTLVNKYCKKCSYASWNEVSVVVCDNIDVYEACWKDNCEDSPPRVHQAAPLCKGEYFSERDFDEINNEISQ